MHKGTGRCCLRNTCLSLKFVVVLVRARLMAAPLAVPSVVTPHTLRHGALLTAPQKTPCAFGTTAFLSARRAVRLLPGIQRFALLEVEESVHTQVLRHVALVVAKSAPVGTPLPGHPSLRSLAPPLPNRPTALGSVGGPSSWAVKKRGRCQGRGSTGVSPKPSRVKRARLLYHSSRALVFYYAILFQHRFSSVFKAETITG